MPYILAVIDPIAVRLGPFEVRWYGIIVVTAVLAAIWLSSREARRLGLNPDFVAEAALWVVPFGFVGARLYEVFILQWPYYRAHPWEIPAIWHGGLAIHGGVLVGVLVGIFFVRRRRANFFQWADIIAPGLIMAQAIGRWGNFFNQEAYGEPAPQWVIDLLPGFIREGMFIGGQVMHPTFLYESLWNLAAFAVLMFWRRANPSRGAIAFGYLALYNLGRFFIEGIRLDSSFIAGFRVAQVVSLALFLAGLAGIWWRSRTITRYQP